MGIIALIAIAILIEIFIKRNRPRPSFAEQFLGEDVNDDDYDKPELGMEAIDMDVIRASEQGNKTAASLGARDMQFWTKQTRRRHPRKSDTPQPRATGEKK
ncbi:hypothetical protein JI58_02920 [Marinosulfonomonas sp. PRT-SC04]|nr:hypothetical protein JI58_02920 [Marinosulfonomonas sp. PRT-SC04]